VQLFGLVYKNEYWPDFPWKWNESDKTKEAKERQRLRVQECLEKEEFKKSNIRLGVVFDNIKDPIAAQMKTTRMRLIEQLSDTSTIIF
jgi:hypothetical protein